MISALQQFGQTGQHFECIATCEELRSLPELLSENWLHDVEWVELARLRESRRRESWRFGRWVAKHLVQQAYDFGDCNLASIAVCSRNEKGELVRPTVLVDGNPLSCSVSISHGERLVVAMLEMDAETTIGIDVVSREPLSASFQETWFTRNEQAWIRESDEACIVWGAKEAAYKACNTGERFAPRKFEIVPDDSGNLTVSYGGCKLPCEFESRVLADDIIVIVKHQKVQQ